MRLFYNEVKDKRKNKRVRLQVDSEFQQVKIKDLNDENNVEMFTSSVSGETKHSLLSKKYENSNLSASKLKIAPKNIILNSAMNMNNLKSQKYELSPEQIEQISLAGERFKTIFNIHRIEKTKKLHDRLDRYDKRRGLREGRKLLFKEKEVKKGLNDQ